MSPCALMYQLPRTVWPRESVEVAVPSELNTKVAFELPGVIGAEILDLRNLPTALLHGAFDRVFLYDRIFVLLQAKSTTKREREQKGCCCAFHGIGWWCMNVVNLRKPSKPALVATFSVNNPYRASDFAVAGQPVEINSAASSGCRRCTERWSSG